MITYEPITAGASDGSTVYVTGAGNDANPGNSWLSAKATIQAAINSLPAKGGIVEVGYGSFAGFAIGPAQPGVTVRGRGMGQTYDPTNNVTTPLHPTTITGAVTVTGPALGSPPEFGCVLEDFAIDGANTVAIGLNINYVPRFATRRVAVDRCTTWGTQITNSYWLPVEQLVITRCGTAGAATPTGGLNLVYPANLSTVQDGVFNYNVGCAAQISAAAAVCFLSCDFSQTQTSAWGQAGQAVVAQVGGPVTFLNCWFENNASRGYRATAYPATAVFIGCYFQGDGVSTDAMTTFGFIFLLNCIFGGHSSGWSLNGSLGSSGVTWQGCLCNDSSGFLQGVTNTAADNVPAAAASSNGGYGVSTSRGVATQTLAANGAVTIDATKGDTAAVTLNANATATTINNGVPGQTLTVEWIQGAGGAHTYAWPANCKFAAGAAPAASVTAGYTDSVTFRFDGTNWKELNRSVGVH